MLVAALPALGDVASATTAPAVENLKNGSFEGSPSNPTADNGYSLSGTAAPSSVARSGKQAVDLGQGGAPVDGSNTLGAVSAKPVADVPLHQVASVSFWYDVPNAVTQNIHLQLYLTASKSGSGSVDACLIDDISAPLSATNGFVSYALPLSKPVQVADGACAVSSGQRSIDDLKADASWSGATLHLLVVQSLVDSGGVWAPAQPVLVDDASILASSSPNVRIVDAAFNRCDGASFATISPALACAAAGAKIVVEPGTYAGDVQITTSGITLCSTAWGMDDCNPTSGVTFLQGAGCYPLSVYADNVTVNGFTITSPDCVGVDQTAGKIDPTAVTVYGNDVSLVNNNVQDFGKTLQPGQSRWAVTGIYVADSSARVRLLSNNVYDLPTARNTDGTCANEPCVVSGILAMGPDATVLGNGVDMGKTTLNPPFVGIGAGDGASITWNFVRFPAVSGNGNQPLEAIHQHGTRASVITDNTVSSASSALGAVYGVYAEGSSSTIARNAITSVGHAILASGATPSIDANRIDNSTSAIESYFNAATITGNFIDNASTAITLNQVVGTRISGNTIRYINPNDNAPATTLIHLEAGSVGVLNAEGNDWFSYSRVQILRNITVDDAAQNSVDVACYQKGSGQVCPPAVSFAVDGTLHQGAQVAFRSTTTPGANAMTKLAWAFGDGGTALGPNAKHAYSSPGVFAATLTATDSEGFTSTATRELAVDDAAPALAEPGNYSLLPGDLFTLTLQAADADHDALRFGAVGLPAGAAVDSASGVFSWTPAAGDRGAHVVTFTVSDGFLNDSRTSVLTVASSIAINVPATLALTEGTTRDVAMNATDPDGAAVTLQVAGLPAWASYADNGDGSGVLHLAPPVGAGTATITLTATTSNATVTRDVLLNATQRVGFTASIVGSRNVIASGGYETPLTVNITNTGTREDSFDLSNASSPGVTLVGASGAVTIPAGETRQVTFFLVTPSTLPQGAVSLTMTSEASPNMKATLAWTFKVPITIKFVPSAPPTFAPTDDVTGTVVVTWANGQGVPNARIKVLEAPHALGTSAGSAVNGTTDDAGAFTFDYGQDPNSRVPGTHDLYVYVTLGTNGASQKSSYAVLVAT